MLLETQGTQERTWVNVKAPLITCQHFLFIIITITGIIIRECFCHFFSPHLAKLKVLKGKHQYVLFCGFSIRPAQAATLGWEARVLPARLMFKTGGLHPMKSTHPTSSGPQQSLPITHGLAEFCTETKTTQRDYSLSLSSLHHHKGRHLLKESNPDKTYILHFCIKIDWFFKKRLTKFYFI